jgi:hypothetical protein
VCLLFNWFLVNLLSSIELLFVTADSGSIDEEAHFLIDEKEEELKFNEKTLKKKITTIEKNYWSELNFLNKKYH